MSTIDRRNWNQQRRALTWDQALQVCRGGGESRKGSNRKKNLGERIELSGELGKREGRRSLSHPFPGLTAGDPHLSASFALLFFSFFFGYQSGHLIVHFSPNAEPGPSLRQLIEPSLKRFYITYAEEKGKQVHSFLGRLYKINNKRRV